LRSVSGTGTGRHRGIPATTGTDRHRTDTDRHRLFYDIFDKIFSKNSISCYLLAILTPVGTVTDTWCRFQHRVSYQHRFRYQHRHRYQHRPAQTGTKRHRVGTTYIFDYLIVNNDDYHFFSFK
jgi:hypothetical protein